MGKGEEGKGPLFPTGPSISDGRKSRLAGMLVLVAVLTSLLT